MSDPVIFTIDIHPDGGTAPDGGWASTVHRVETDAPTLYVTDLGASRGDGIFETFGVIDGHPQSVAAHLARLANSASLLELPAPNEEQWREAIRIAAAAVPTEVQCGLKLVLTRGIEGTGSPTGWIVASEAGSVFAERIAGIRVVTLDRGYPSDIAQRAPWLLAGAKTLSYAVNMAAQREARRRGADDAIFVSSDGFVMEAPTSTVIVRRGDTFVTPRADIGILPGTAQLALFDFYRNAGFDTKKVLIPVSELTDSDGIWLVSSVRLATPVTHIDGAPLAVDHAMTERMNAALLARDA
ncbi:aminodeoxychorismate lyase [Rathayibacter soli]|uniref:aminodeoxychorismate lyase n=1 Tax=Rathayibacter soli TaxID=3144168 RepID=UPI0027E545B7|nr:aminodeoxychorismate lyase [Glaciibacter superstes]